MVDLGLGRKIASIVAKRLARVIAERGGIRPDAVTLSRRHFGTDAADEQGAIQQGLVSIDGSEGASIQLASCCRPIPGDDIVGYLGRGEGLTVHTAECAVGKRLFERDSERWMPVEWSEQPVRLFETLISVLVTERQGCAGPRRGGRERRGGRHHSPRHGRRAGQRVRRIAPAAVSVRDRQHLADVLRTLKRAPSVLRVSRVKA